MAKTTEKKLFRNDMYSSLSFLGCNNLPTIDFKRRDPSTISSFDIVKLRAMLHADRGIYCLKFKNTQQTPNLMSKMIRTGSDHCQNNS